MHLRPFQRGDERALHDVYYAAIHGLASQHYNQAQINAWAPATYNVSRWEEKMQALNPFVIEKDDTLIAYADLQDDGLIDHFFVSAENAKQGVGKWLMQHIIATAKAKDISKMHAHVSLTAQPFFEKHSFKLIQRQEVIVREVALTNALMERIVPSA
jgi:putative acetyltransferase